jgi:GNAT superfamily N-acetyltransferase
MTVTFRDEPFDGAPARTLLEQFEEEVAVRYPGWRPTAAPSASPEDFMPPQGRFVVAYERGEPVACAGLKRFDDRAVEVKRLFVAAGARGCGVARALLGHLEQAAAEAGYLAVRLDTGNRQPEALALFRSAGYREIPDYNGNRFASYWFEKAV